MKKVVRQRRSRGKGISSIKNGFIDDKKTKSQPPHSLPLTNLVGRGRVGGLMAAEGAPYSATGRRRPQNPPLCQSHMVEVGSSDWCINASDFFKTSQRNFQSNRDN